MNYKNIEAHINHMKTLAFSVSNTIFTPRKRINIDMPWNDVITSYSIHYTKLYDPLALFHHKGGYFASRNRVRQPLIAAPAQPAAAEKQKACSDAGFLTWHVDSYNFV